MQGYGAGAVIILPAARCFLTRSYEFLMTKSIFSFSFYFYREIEGSHCGVSLQKEKHVRQAEPIREKTEMFLPPKTL